jgi:hypothetical protein
VNTSVNLEYLDKGSREWYYSLIVLLDDEKVKVLASNVKLPFKRMLLGFSERGKFEFVEIQSGKIWRAKH